MRTAHGIASPRQRVGVPAAVDALVVIEDDFGHGFVEPEALDQRQAGLRVVAQARPFPLGQPPRLLQDAFGDFQLPEVVQEGRQPGWSRWCSPAGRTGSPGGRRTATPGGNAPLPMGSAPPWPPECPRDRRQSTVARSPFGWGTAGPEGMFRLSGTDTVGLWAGRAAATLDPEPLTCAMISVCAGPEGPAGVSRSEGKIQWPVTLQH